MKNKTRVFFGILLLLLGVSILLNNLNLNTAFDLSIVTRFFWPSIFLGLGLIMLFDKNLVPGVFFSLIGTTMILNRLFEWNFWSVFWPLILVGLGLYTLLKKDDNIRLNSAQTESDENKINDNVIFWGSEKVINSKDFKGGDINTLFGGYKLDLRDAKISKDGAKINVNCMFGGVEILVPDNCKVISSGSGILGGWDSNFRLRDTKEPVLEISGVASLGGVEIK